VESIERKQYHFASFWRTLVDSIEGIPLCKFLEAEVGSGEERHLVFFKLLE